MMSKTHIAVGIASALAFAPVGTVEACVAAVIGGSVGGIIADCDITPSRAHKDALLGRIIVVAVALVALLVDYMAGIDVLGTGGPIASSVSGAAGLATTQTAADAQTGAGLCAYLLAHLGVPFVVGVVMFAFLTFAGSHTDHRSFTHSLAAFAAFSFAVYLACAPLLVYFMAGYASHLVLDIANHQPIRLFWPLGKGVSLGLCQAKGAVNNAVLVLGAIAAAALLAYHLAPLLGFGMTAGAA